MKRRFSRKIKILNSIAKELPYKSFEAWKIRNIRRSQYIQFVYIRNQMIQILKDSLRNLIETFMW